MSTRLLLLLICLPLALPAQVYRYVDEQGRVIFTDRPLDGAQPVELPPPSVYQPTPLPRPAARADEEQTRPAYSRLVVASPPDQSIVRDNQGLVEVKLEIEPSLRQGHVVELLLDGKVAARGTGSRYRLENIHRGEYQLQVRIRNSQGQVVAESSPSVFYMHQASRLFLHR